MAKGRRRVTIAERRARLVARHHLGGRLETTSARRLAGDLAGLHATDPRTPYLSVWARSRGTTVEAIQRELYEDRTLVRMLGMRRTLFVVPLDLAAVVHAACGLTVAARERRRLLDRLRANGVTAHPERWLRDVEEDTVRALEARGEATAMELARDVPLLATKILLAEGRSYQAEQSVSFWILLGLAAQGRIVRGRPRGTWISRQHRWTPARTWLREPLAELSTDGARTELVRRWLASYGPGTVADLKWWTGLTTGEVRRALSGVRTVEFDLEGGAIGLLLADDAQPVRRRRPRAALLPSLDSTVMGWAERDWYLGRHRAALFDRNGNAGPTVWWGGRVVGGWGQRADGRIVFRLLEDVGSEAVAAVEREAARLEAWLAGTRVIAAFGTPLERELVGG